MIAESTPFGGINLNTTDTVAYGENDPWDRWFGKVIDLIERYDVSLTAVPHNPVGAGAHALSNPKLLFKTDRSLQLHQLQLGVSANVAQCWVWRHALIKQQRGSEQVA